MLAVGNFGVAEAFGKLDFKFPKSANGSFDVGLLCGTEPFVFRDGVGEGTLFGCRGVAEESPQSPNKSALLLVWACDVLVGGWELLIPKRSSPVPVGFAPNGLKLPEFVPLFLEPKG